MNKFGSSASKWKKRTVDILLDAMGDGVVIMGLDGNIIKVNKAFEKLSKLKSKEVIGKPALTILTMPKGEFVKIMKDVMKKRYIGPNEIVEQQNINIPRNWKRPIRN